VGNVKVAVAPSTHYKYGDRLWACEMHQIVTGCDEMHLKKAFSRLREGGAFLNKVSIKPVEDLKECICRVFQRDLRPWQKPELEPWQPKPELVRPTEGEQTEYYAWLLGLTIGTRTIRYGCDRDFNRVTRKLKPWPVPKKRRYPYHLKPYMFGYGWKDDIEVCWRGDCPPGSEKDR
jgi:hypothetical protein